MAVYDGDGDDLIPVSYLNQFLYCPRRLYYLQYYQTQGMNEFLLEGRLLHQKKGRRGGYLFEVYVRSFRLGLHGKIDLIDCTEGILPVERKRGYRFFENDTIQLCAYGLLLEEYLGSCVDRGVLYLYETGRRHVVVFTDFLRERTHETIDQMRGMSVECIPDFVDNPKKCEKCSVHLYCLPYESRVLEGRDE